MFLRIDRRIHMFAAAMVAALSFSSPVIADFNAAPQNGNIGRMAITRFCGPPVPMTCSLLFIKGDQSVLRMPVN